MGETQVIRYNLRDRGRKHTGNPRNFNIRAIADAINSPSCQEMVETGGLFGYYGHMPRIRFGMQPCEGGIDAGKYVPVEPAFITTHLKADYDGNVEHKARFLDTVAGRLAEKLWSEKVGGFSSAIDDAKPEFFGFDFVLAPNFVNNSYRGVVMDDAYGGRTGELTYDDVYQAEQEEQAASMEVLLDTLHRERHMAADTLERLTLENEQLLSMLAAKGGTFDGIHTEQIMPMIVSVEAENRLNKDVQAFKATAVLPRFVEPSKPQQDNPLVDRLLHRFRG